MARKNEPPQKPYTRNGTEFAITKLQFLAGWSTRACYKIHSHHLPAALFYTLTVISRNTSEKIHNNNLHRQNHIHMQCP